MDQKTNIRATSSPKYQGKKVLIILGIDNIGQILMEGETREEMAKRDRIDLTGGFKTRFPQCKNFNGRVWSHKLINNEQK